MLVSVAVVPFQLGKVVRLGRVEIRKNKTKQNNKAIRTAPLIHFNFLEMLGMPMKCLHSLINLDNRLTVS